MFPINCLIKIKIKLYAIVCRINILTFANLLNSEA